MFHFLLILDDDAERLAHMLGKARILMRRLTGNTPVELLQHRNMALLAYGDERQRQFVQEAASDEWRLGIGGWTGPALPPAAETLRRADADALIRYDNLFCFVGGQIPESTAYAVVDPIGRMHVYHAKPSSTSVLLSNSALALGALIGAAWHTEGVREFLAKGTVFQDNSLFQGVSKLVPGKVYKFAPAATTTHDLPRLDAHAVAAKSDTLTAFTQAATDALDAALERAHAPLLDLTGGFDSRLMLATMMQQRPAAEISTVVIGKDDDRDVIVANAIARRFGLRHRHLQRPNNDELTPGDLVKSLLATDGEFDIVEYAKIMLNHKRLAEEFDASVNGSGGEMIRDEWWQVFTRPLGGMEPWDAQRLAARRFATDPWGERMLAEAPTNTLGEHFADIIERTVSHLADQPTTRLVDEIYLYMRMQRWQGRLASATHSVWPNHSPLLMRGPLTIALQAPLELRRNGLMPRLLLERTNPQLAAMPMVDGAPATPPNWNNLYRHLPRYRARGRHYLNAVLKRGRRALPGRSTSSASEPPADVLRPFLQPQDMLSARLYSPSALDAAARSFHDGGLGASHAGRLITLELTARTIDELRREFAGPA